MTENDDRLSPTPAGTGTDTRHPDVAEAIEGETRLHDPVVRRSRALTEALFDPEFIEVGASGRRWTHAEMLDAVPTFDNSLEGGPRIVADRFEGTVLAPGIVHLTYETDIDGRRARRSSIWRRDPVGAYRLYYHQGTPVP